MSLADHEIEDDRPDEPPCAGIEHGCTCEGCLAAWRDTIADWRVSERKEQEPHG